MASQNTPLLLQDDMTVHGLKPCSFFKIPPLQTTKMYYKYNKRCFLTENGKALFIQTGVYTILKTQTLPLKQKTPKYGDSKTDEISFISYNTNSINDEIICMEVSMFHA